MMEVAIALAGLTLAFIGFVAGSSLARQSAYAHGKWMGALELSTEILDIIEREAPGHGNNTQVRAALDAVVSRLRRVERESERELRWRP